MKKQYLTESQFAKLISETIQTFLNEDGGIYNNQEDTSFDDVQTKLANGIAPKDIFEFVGDYYGGFAKIKLNGKRNYINQGGKLLSPDLWFDRAYNFSDGVRNCYR